MAPPNTETSADRAVEQTVFRIALKHRWRELSEATARTNIELTPHACDAVIHACDELRLLMQNTKRYMGLT